MMIAPLFLALLAPATDLGPMLPPGVNPAFQATVVAVEQKLEAGDFEAAAKLGTLLPKTAITIQWDDSKVPASLRAEYAKQRDEAIKTWAGITEATIKLGNSKPDLKFDFVEVLPNPPGSGIPAGATYFWSETPGDTRLETVIGLKRMTPPEDISPVNIFNETAAALGSYFGLTPQPFPGTLMGRSDMNNQQAAVAMPAEMLLARETMKVAHDLRDAIQKKKRLTPATPKVFFDPKSIDMGSVTQGDNPTFNVQITNSGNAPLAMRFQPDCGCVSTSEKYQVIQPGSTYVLKGAYNTLQTTGEIHHTILVNTNDGETPNFMVPVTVHVKPLFRFVLPEGNVVKLPEQGTTIPIYLFLADDSNITPKDAQIAGVPGDVKFEPWSGEMADPQANEGPKMRHGYKLTVHLTGTLLVPGRSPATVWMSTNHPSFPTLQTNFFAQRGIVVLPGELYMGEVAPGVRKYSLIVSGPAKSFKINKVSSDWPFVTFETFPNADGTEYRIQATYDGKAPSGPVNGTVTIETDDKAQPVISIPIHATIK